MSKLNLMQVTHEQWLLKTLCTAAAARWASLKVNESDPFTFNRTLTYLKFGIVSLSTLHVDIETKQKTMTKNEKRKSEKSAELLISASHAIS